MILWDYRHLCFLSPIYQPTMKLYGIAKEDQAQACLMNVDFEMFSPQTKRSASREIFA